MRNFIELTCFMGFPQQQEKKFPGGAKGMQAVEVTVHKVYVDLAAIKIVEQIEEQPFRSIIIFHDKDHINVMEDRITIRTLMLEAYNGANSSLPCSFTEPVKEPPATE